VLQELLFDLLAHLPEFGIRELALGYPGLVGHQYRFEAELPDSSYGLTCVREDPELPRRHGAPNPSLFRVVLQVVQDPVTVEEYCSALLRLMRP